MNLKFITDADQLKDKVIDFAKFDVNRYCFFLKFTDGSCFLLASTHDSEEDIDVYLEVDKTIEYHSDNIKHSFGFLSDQEYETIQNKKREMYQRQTRQDELAMLARLKAKYEGK